VGLSSESCGQIILLGLLANDDDDDVVVVAAVAAAVVAVSMDFCGIIDPSSEPIVPAKSMLALPPMRPIFFKNFMALLSSSDAPDRKVLVVVVVVVVVLVLVAVPLTAENNVRGTNARLELVKAVIATAEATGLFIFHVCY